jgi:hypothetical protein
MPEPKKAKRTFDAQVESQLAGLTLVRSQRPVAPKPGPARPKPPASGDPLQEIHAPEPEIVSKLIDFIKSI